MRYGEMSFVIAIGSNNDILSSGVRRLSGRVVAFEISCCRKRRYRLMRKSLIIWGKYLLLPDISRVRKRRVYAVDLFAQYL